MQPYLSTFLNWGGRVSQALYIENYTRHPHRAGRVFPVYSDFKIGPLFQHQRALMHENLPTSHSCLCTPKGATSIPLSILLWGRGMHLHALTHMHTLMALMDQYSSAPYPWSQLSPSLSVNQGSQTHYSTIRSLEGDHIHVTFVMVCCCNYSILLWVIVDNLIPGLVYKLNLRVHYHPQFPTSGEVPEALCQG